MIGKLTATSKLNIVESPSNPTANRLPRSGNHSTLFFNNGLPLCTDNPQSETASVISEDNKAQLRAPRSLFRRKATNPLTRGITINKTGIISNN